MMNCTLSTPGCAAALLMALMVTACGNGEQAPAPASAVRAAYVQLAPPADAVLAGTYEGTCKTCHAVPGSGAPAAGDRAAWNPRIAQGRQQLLDHVFNGYKAMPPMGLCQQCSEDDMVALIEYMAGASLK